MDSINVMWKGTSASNLTNVSDLLKVYRIYLQFQSNFVALSRGALDLTLMVNQLVDMEWKFGGLITALCVVLIYHCLSLVTFDN